MAGQTLEDSVRHLLEREFNLEVTCSSWFFFYRFYKAEWEKWPVILHQRNDHKIIFCALLKKRNILISMRRNLKIKNKISIWYHVLSYLRSSLYLLCYISKKAVKKYYRYMVFCQDNVCFGWYDSTSEKKTLSTVLAVFGCNAAHHGKRSLTCPADSTHLCQELLNERIPSWLKISFTNQTRTVRSAAQESVFSLQSDVCWE